MKKDLFTWIIFLDVLWDSPCAKNRQHFLVEALSRILPDRSKIFALERPLDLLIGPVFKTRKFLRTWFEKNPPRKVAENLILYTPRILFHDIFSSSISFIRKMNRAFVKHQIESLLKTMEINGQKLIVMVQHPYQLETLQWFNSAFKIYDCHDEYTQAQERFPGQNKGIAKKEQELLKEVDLVLAVSERLMEKIKKHHERVFLLSNAADIEHFSMARKQDLPISEEVASLPRPIAGFIGKLTPRVDYTLLVQLIKEMPHVFFLFIGPIESPFPEVHLFLKKMNAQSNFRYVGPKQYTELPKYMKCMDIGLIPYRPDPFNISSNPLKIYEYLSAGKPVVCTGISIDYEVPSVKVCNSIEDVSHAIKAILNGANQKDIHPLYEIPSWTKQVSILIEKIDELCCYVDKRDGLD